MTIFGVDNTVLTLGSQGVTRDGREQYQTKFIDKNFV
jgi:hypothetical protein